MESDEVKVYLLYLILLLLILTLGLLTNVC
jgi:hypothetical protein